MNKRTNTIIWSVVSVLLLVLATIRAINIPLTHDESITYSVYVGKSVTDIIGYVETYGMPNNHILNTLLIKLTTFLFGNSTLVIRLPNILALSIYLLFAWKISGKLKSSFLQWSLLLLLCFNPYIFEFFSLARGYGLANALLLAAVYYCLNWYETQSARDAIYMFVCGSLMVLSNFATLHVFTILLIVFSFFTIRRNRPKTFRSFTKVLTIPLVFSVGLAAILYEPFRCIIKWKTTYGGTTGFWTDGVMGFISATAYGASYSDLMIKILLPFIAISLLCIGLIALVEIIRSKTVLHVFPAFILSGVFLLIECQHFLLGTEFPPGRAIQFIHPLYVMSFIFCAASVVRFEKVIYGVAVLSGFLLLIHFEQRENISFSNEWKYDACNREVFDDLAQLKKQNQITSPVTLGVTWIFEPGLNYERVYRNAAWLKPITRDSKDSSCTYYYVTLDDSILLAGKGKTVVKYYPLSNGSLMK